MVNLKDFAVNLLMILFNARFNALGLGRFRCCWVSIGICCGCLEPQPSHSTVRYYSHPSAYGRGGLVTSHLPVTRDSSTYIHNFICFQKSKPLKLIQPAIIHFEVIIYFMIMCLVLSKENNQLQSFQVSRDSPKGGL